MNIDEFDNLVKKHMTELKVAPSSELKHALAFKLFFRNLLFFHKIKLIAAIALIGTSSVLVVSYLPGSETKTDENSNEIVLEKEIHIEEPSSNNTNPIEIASPKEEINSNVNHSDETESTSNKNETMTSATNEVEYTSFEQKAKTNNEQKNSVASEGNAPIASSGKQNTSKEFADNQSVEQKVNDSKTEANLAVNNVDKDSDFVPSDASINEVDDNVSNQNIAENNAPLNKENVVFTKAEVIQSGIATEKLIECSQPDLNTIAFDGDYANTPKKRGFSFDAYVNPFGKNKIENELDAFYKEYWWDFYKDFDFVKSGIGGGINVNYEWNHFKIASGLNLNTVYDYRPNYKYFFDNVLVPYGGDAVSGVSIYEQDTALIFHVDQYDSKTIKEIGSDHNKYSYINVPLTLGYELNTKFFSFEVNGGIEYGRLSAAKGLGISKGEVDENPYPQGVAEETYTVYYYRNKYMETMDRKSTFLQKNTFGYVGNAVLRVHVTGSLDIFSSFKYKQLLNGMYQYSYMLQKKYNSYGLNFGITYHLNNRIKSSSVRFN